MSKRIHWDEATLKRAIGGGKIISWRVQRCLGSRPWISSSIHRLSIFDICYTASRRSRSWWRWFVGDGNWVIFRWRKKGVGIGLHSREGGWHTTFDTFVLWLLSCKDLTAMFLMFIFMDLGKPASFLFARQATRGGRNTLRILVAAYLVFSLRNQVVCGWKE